MGNTLTFEMAKAAIEGESLGSRADETDFLAMSHSATDYVGHRYGTFAVETEDTYLRLDKDLADFFRYLDGRFGRDGYLFILTAEPRCCAQPHLRPRPQDPWAGLPQ